MAAPQVEQPSESLKHKTWILKVSIPCPCGGCKKKVKKILQNVQGVNSVDVDTKQQKVTVTGNVGADALINKLTKSGRHAQLWPDQSDKKSATLKLNDPQTNKEIQKAVKFEVSAAEPTKVTQGSETAAGKNSGGGEGVKGKEPAAKKPETESAGHQSQPPPPPEESKDHPVVAAAAGGGKKKKKGQNGKFAEGEPSSGAAAASTGSINHNPAPPRPVSAPANQIPPRHQAYQYPPPPPTHYNEPPPEYGVSYNTAPPSSSYTASYYTAPPPYMHAYSHMSRETAPPPSDIDSHPRQPLDSFEILSDENPNGCSIM